MHNAATWTPAWINVRHRVIFFFSKRPLLRVHHALTHSLARRIASTTERNGALFLLTPSFFFLKSRS